MTETFTALTSGMTWLLSAMGDVVTFVSSNALTIIPTVIFITGAAIGLFKRLA